MLLCYDVHMMHELKKSDRKIKALASIACAAFVCTGFLSASAQSWVGAESMNGDSLRVELMVDSTQMKNQFSDLKVEDSSNATPERRVFFGFEDEKTPVNPKDLPKAVTSALRKDDFKNWKQGQAVLVRTQDGDFHYEIALHKEDKMQVAKLKDNGKML